MREKKFCKCCGIRLKENFFSKKYYEFEDGNYCEPCARLRVKRSRDTRAIIYSRTEEIDDD